MKLQNINESHNNLLSQLLQLRPQMAYAAQKIYDLWEPNDEYDEFNGGGCCDAIASAINDILTVNDINTTEGGHEGDDHSYIIAYNETESYIVDVPYNLYEYGGGYSWNKIENVKFNPNDISIAKIDRPDWI